MPSIVFRFVTKDQFSVALPTSWSQFQTLIFSIQKFEHSSQSTSATETAGTNINGAMQVTSYLPRKNLYQKIYLRHMSMHSDTQCTCCTKRWLKLPSILFLCTSNTSPSSNEVEPSDQRTMRALLSFISFPSSSFLNLHRIVFSTQRTMLIVCSFNDKTMTTKSRLKAFTWDVLV